MEAGHWNGVWCTEVVAIEYTFKDLVWWQTHLQLTPYVGYQRMLGPRNSFFMYGVDGEDAGVHNDTVAIRER